MLNLNLFFLVELIKSDSFEDCLNDYYVKSQIYIEMKGFIIKKFLYNSKEKPLNKKN